MFRAKDRGKSLALASLLPYLGPAVGPIVGGSVSQYLQWHWLFWIISIVDAAVAIIGLLLLRESYTPVLLRRKAALKSTVSPVILSPRAKFTDFCTRLRTGVARPVTLLLNRPTIQLLALWFGLNFGIYTLMLSTYANIWIVKYQQTPTRAALNYVAIVVGMTTATQAGGPVMDYIYRRLSARSPPRPEFRAPYMAIGVLLVPVGLLLFGWAARAHTHWAVVDVGVAIFAFGNFLFAQAQLAYLLDEFEHGASANAAARLLSHVIGFLFPIFGPAMYARLGFGWGNTLLAGMWILIGVPAPAVLWIWGERLRGIRWRKGE
ncbi:MFS general substrate transporter [Pseudovirgaria hyperparasitica]|uniref:MFS general substrate transporter n=1 Tax=Pseudovirgaria hyperparasitica TaxID=470096 RepID=A0A6A6W444_9PEZI|nr:MFS general substrate transporter [Pseudovirgaria hyperparasitica]KAF2757393.1 MFS general substrate transporter [Pseudovirgaria hyperparasitica]